MTSVRLSLLLALPLAIAACSDSDGGGGGASPTPEPSAHPCDGVICTSPPEDSCRGATLVQFSRSGACLGGDCVYDSIETDCAAMGGVCVDLACTDACTGVVCNSPPPGSCSGSTAIGFTNPGTCTAGACNYEEQRVDCEAMGETCSGGVCVGEGAIAPGEIIISELLFDPAGDDAGLEYLELYNRSGRVRDLMGLTLGDDSGEEAVPIDVSIRLAAGDRLLIEVLHFEEDAADPRPEDNGRDGRFAVLDRDLRLNNERDSVVLKLGDEVISRVAYAKLDDVNCTLRFPGGEGVAMQIPPSRIDDVDFDAKPDEWCAATTPMSGDDPRAGNLGTPGGRNDSCEPFVVCPAPAATCEDNAPVTVDEDGSCNPDSRRCEFSPRAGEACSGLQPLCVDGACVDAPGPDIRRGELLITEVLWNPVGEEGRREYFEIYNAGDRALELEGLLIDDESFDTEDRDTVRLTDAVTLSPGEYFVFGRHSTETPAGDAVDAVFDFALNNDEDSVIIRTGEVILDRFDYIDLDLREGGALERQLDSLGCDNPDRTSDLSCWCPSDTPLGRSHWGTPGAVHGACAGWTRCFSDRDCGEGRPPVCDGEDAVQVFDFNGICMSAGVCEYPPLRRENCARNEVCRAGTCQPDGADMGRPPVAGELIITEVMYNPSVLPETGGEYFEVYNAASETLQLFGLYVGDERNGEEIENSVLMRPGEFAFFAYRSDPAENGGLEPDDAFSDDGRNQLGNNGDTVFIGKTATAVTFRPGENLIASFEWSGSAAPEGSAVQMEPDCYENQPPLSGDACWCPAEDDIDRSISDKGSPGAANHPCD